MLCLKQLLLAGGELGICSRERGVYIRQTHILDIRQGSGVSSVVSCYSLVACLQGKPWTEAGVEKGQQDGGKQGI